MSFLPIVERELRERARWRSTYWVRGLAAFLATAIAMFVLMFLSAAGPGTVGKGMLMTLAWLAFPFVVLEGLRNTADALSEEKREGTLGLLFLTDLKGYDVVLGKFLASSLTSLYAVLAMLPALAVPVLLGGVTGGEFWRLVLALINALLFSLTTGMFVSSISRSERRAWTGTFGLLLLFVVAVPVVSKSLHVPVIWMFSPFTAFWLFDDASYGARPAEFWQSLGGTQLLGGCWMALASFLLPRVWQESGAGRARHVPLPSTVEARAHRAKVLSTNPVWWLTARHTHQRRWLWVFVFFIGALEVTCWLLAQGNMPFLWSIFGGAIAVHLALAVWVAFEACDSFAEARASGALELMLSTPLPVRQIVRGQHLALRELFLGPVVLLLAVEACLAGAQVWVVAQGPGGGFQVAVLILVFGFCLVWFALDMLAVAEVGMWFGLTSQKTTQALTRTVVFVLVLPLVFLGCCWFVGPGLMVAKSVIFFTWAQSKLENEFRRAATERFDETRKPKWLRRGPSRLQMPG